MAYSSALRGRVGRGGVIIEGDERAIASLRRLRSRLEDFSWLWMHVVDLFIQKEQAHFDSRGRGTWPPLSPAYAAWKARVRPGRPTLVFDGDLRRELVTSAFSGQPITLTDRMVVLGSTVPYAIYHHEGRGVPKRSPLIATESLIAGLLRRLQYEIERTV